MAHQQPRFDESPMQRLLIFVQSLLITLIFLFTIALPHDLIQTRVIEVTDGDSMIETKGSRSAGTGWVHIKMLWDDHGAHEVVSLTREVWRDEITFGCGRGNGLRMILRRYTNGGVGGVK